MSGSGTSQEEFVKELRTGGPGSDRGPGAAPGVHLPAGGKLQDWRRWYSLIAISVLVLLHFRSVLGTCCWRWCPWVVGFLWLCGMMGYFGIPFNPANIMTLPLVIGIGVTNGIHILNRFAEEHDPGHPGARAPARQCWCPT